MRPLAHKRTVYLAYEAGLYSFSRAPLLRERHYLTFTLQVSSLVLQRQH